MLRGLLLITLCAAAIVFSGITERPLLKSSEGRVARVAQEMLDDGDWVVPHLNGEVRVEKPPLPSWLVALTTLAAGERKVQPWHAYVPPALATIALLLLVFAWVSKQPVVEQTDGYAGLLAAFFLALAPGFLMQARSAESDMQLALAVALIFWGFWAHHVHGSRAALLAGYAAIALAIHTKGHVGLVIAVPALLLWNLVERRHYALHRAPAGSLRWHPLGVALVAALVLPWAIPFLQKSGLTWATFNREGGAGRFSTETGHRENLFWYFYQIPGWFLPWFIFLPLGIWQTWHLPPDHRSPLRRLCWCWFGWSLLLFSILTAKQRHYAVPFFAPLAILIADALIRWWNAPQSAALQGAAGGSPASAGVDAGAAAVSRASGPALAASCQWHPRHLASGISLLLAVCCAIVPLLGTRGGPLSPIVAAQFGEDFFFIDDYKVYLVWLTGLGAAAAFLAGSVLLNQRRNWAPAWWIGGALTAVLFGATLEYQESLAGNELPRFCARVNKIVPKDAVLHDYNVVLANKTWRAQVLYYLNRKVTRPAQPLDKLLSEAWEKRAVVYALATGKVLADVPPELYERLTGEDKFLGHRNDVFLVRSRSGAPRQ